MTTARDDTVYVHVLDWPDSVLSLPAIGRHVTTARMLATGAEVTVVQSEQGITLTLPPRADAVPEPDRVVVLELAAPARR